MPKSDNKHYPPSRLAGLKPYKKGQSGNPKGRPPTPPEIKEALQGHSLEAVNKAYDLMMNSTNEMVQLKATEMFLSPFVSKAAQKVDIDHQVTHNMSDLIAKMNASMAAVGQDTEVIDVTPVENISPKKPDASL